MRTNNDFRKAKNYSDGGEQTKGKLVPKKEKLSKNSVIDELEEDEEIGYLSLRERESISDYYDDDEYEENDYYDEYEDEK